MKYLFSSLLLIFLVSCGTGKEYQAVIQSDDAALYEAFLLKHPKSKYATDVSTRLNGINEKTDYSRAKDTGSIGLYEAFISDYPDSKLLPLAKEELLVLKDARDWQIARSVDEIKTFNDYLNKYPATQHKEEALARMAALRATAKYDAAMKADTEEQLRLFMRQFPDDARVKKVEARIERLQALAAWEAAEKMNTISGYRSFYTNYPGAPEAKSAKDREQRLAESDLYDNVIDSGSAVALRSYLSKYPSGRYQAQVNKALKELEVYGPAWQRAERLNTIEAYQDFVSKYPASSMAYKARRKVRELEAEERARELEARERARELEAEKREKAALAAKAASEKRERDELNLYSRAKRNKSKRDYQRYLKTYPEGRFVQEAEEAIIDLEVDEIFRGDYGQLPAMQQSRASSYSATTSIEVKNDTKYTLTVRYSGPTSKRVEIPRGGSRSFSLASGSYKITASVSAQNVQNYAGSESLSGGEYSSKFYIETTTSYGRRY